MNNNLESNNKIILLNPDDIISGSSQHDVILIKNNTFKVQEIMNKLTHTVKDAHWSDVNKWSVEGVECEVLIPNKTWQKGKVKFCIEFIPDEPEINEIESPLDDIRQSIN